MELECAAADLQWRPDCRIHRFTWRSFVRPPRCESAPAIDRPGWIAAIWNVNAWRRRCKSPSQSSFRAPGHACSGGQFELQLAANQLQSPHGAQCQRDAVLYMVEVHRQWFGFFAPRGRGNGSAPRRGSIQSVQRQSRSRTLYV